MPLSADHAKSLDKQRSQVGPGGHRNFPQAEHCCRSSSLPSVKAQNCSAYGSIARTGRAVAIVTLPWCRSGSCTCRPRCGRLAWDHALAPAVLGVYVRVLLGFQGHRARRSGIRHGRSGCVTVIQRFGGGLNLKRRSWYLPFSSVRDH